MQAGHRKQNIDFHVPKQDLLQGKSELVFWKIQVSLKLLF